MQDVLFSEVVSTWSSGAFIGPFLDGLLRSTTSLDQIILVGEDVEFLRNVRRQSLRSLARLLLSITLARN